MELGAGHPTKPHTAKDHDWTPVNESIVVERVIITHNWVGGHMKGKNYTPEQIIRKLREGEGLIASDLLVRFSGYRHHDHF